MKRFLASFLSLILFAAAPGLQPCRAWGEAIRPKSSARLSSRRFSKNYLSLKSRAGFSPNFRPGRFQTGPRGSRLHLPQRLDSRAELSVRSLSSGELGEIAAALEHLGAQESSRLPDREMPDAVKSRLSVLIEGLRYFQKAWSSATELPVSPDGVKASLPRSRPASFDLSVERPARPTPAASLQGEGFSDSGGKAGALERMVRRARRVLDFVRALGSKPPAQPVLPAVPQSPAYVQGRIYDPGFIRRERADARFTVVWDLNGTLEAHDDRTDKNAVYLRPQAEEVLKSLKDRGVKLVLWSQAEKWWVDGFFQKFPQIAPYFERVITRENYMDLSGKEFAEFPEASAVHRRFPRAKNLSLLGYDLLVDNLSEAAAVAKKLGYAHVSVPSYRVENAGAEEGALAKALEAVQNDPSQLSRVSWDGHPVRVLDLKADLPEIQKSLGASPLVFAINRSILTLAASPSGLMPQRAAGGAAPAIYSALQLGGGGLVLAAAMTPAERRLAQRGKILNMGKNLWVRYLDVPPETFEAYYNGFANSFLWPVQHGLFSDFHPDSGGESPQDKRLFSAYRKVNALFARAALPLLQKASFPRIFIQDYHLYLLPQILRRSRPSAGVLQQFIHIPWVSAAYIRAHLPFKALKEILKGMLGNDILGFQTKEDARNFMDTASEVLGLRTDRESGVVFFGERRVRVSDYPISVDAEHLSKILESDAALAQIEKLSRLRRGKTLVVRVDRMDPTKGILEGLKALRQMLRSHPELKEKLMFYCVLQPSREKNPAYQRLQTEIKSLVREINREFSPDAQEGFNGILENQQDFQGFLNGEGKAPVVVAQMTGLPYQEVLALFSLMDVGLVNPKKDGMNLVAKEMMVAKDPELLKRLNAKLQSRGSSLRLGHGAIVASSRMGAYSELKEWGLHGHVFGIGDPTDIEETGLALYLALDSSIQEREGRAAALAAHVRQNNLKAWLDSMLRDVEGP
ncbi:MAG: hypothetical protein A3G41_06195 [Elusimicrobia bacterium RIFCSPLOWO2_12_FULL_59_9]|nr:MAG: hypothetical protein A3G41_06195 [Elusimicrobia bacterium RIFCSPLOWO2_12_FULL_59_9]